MESDKPKSNGQEADNTVTETIQQPASIRDQEKLQPVLLWEIYFLNDILSDKLYKKMCQKIML
jgi:hypothetical protein